MRYYTYISTTKVDMLFSQIPENFWNDLDAELSFNLGIVGGKISSDKKTDLSEVQRLEVVEAYLRSEKRLTLSAETHGWLEGCHKFNYLTDDTTPGLLVFTTRISDVTIVLAGSEHNLVSSVGPSQIRWNWSFGPRMLQGLDQLIATNSRVLGSMHVDEDTVSSLMDHEVRTQVISMDPTGTKKSAMWDLHDAANGNSFSTKQNFLARVFSVQDIPKRGKLVLGSPVYMADTD